jgi:cytochrome c
MKSARHAFVGCVIALASSLLLARVHPFGDAGLDAATPAPPLMAHSSIPPDVRATLTAKCADCHSLQTRLPVYDRVAIRFAPVSWVLERDIIEGRRNLNLSIWDRYSVDQQRTLEAKIVQETRARRMPLPQYRIIHTSARITDADVQAFTQWMRSTADPVRAAATQPTQIGDPVRGREIFEKRCSGCHALEQNREGPRLQDVYGRTSGTVSGFPYSPALLKAHIVWNDASLDQWLADPDSVVPGNDMDFHVPQGQERRDLIRFLQQIAAK